MPPSSLSRRALHASVLAIFTALIFAGAGHAQPTDTDPPNVTPGFWRLIETAPDIVGAPVQSERGGDVEGSTIVVTSTGLLYWQEDLRPTWTNGYERLTLDAADQIVKWAGDLLKPPAPPAFNFGGALGGVDSRIYCIEGIESHHGAAMYNPVDINGVLNGPGPHAAGYLGWLPGTAAHWGAKVGNRESEWAAARRMFAETTEQFMRGQFYGVGTRQC